MIQKITGSDANVQMIFSDVLVVMPYQPLRRAPPNQRIGYPKHDKIVIAQAAFSIDGLSSFNLLFCYVHFSSPVIRLCQRAGVAVVYMQQFLCADNSSELGECFVWLRLRLRASQLSGALDRVFRLWIPTIYSTHH